MVAQLWVNFIFIICFLGIFITVTSTNVYTSTCTCTNNCELDGVNYPKYCGNGICEDGGPGAHANIFALGDDCSDCGPSSRTSFASENHECKENWHLLFRQTAGIYNNQADWLEYNAEDTAQPTFSQLQYLEAYRQSDGFFEFKLVWPFMTEDGENTQHWRQTNNFLEEG